jgi:hypothetical protein
VAVLVTMAVGAKILTLTLAPGGSADQAGGANTGLGGFWDLALFTAVQALYLLLTCLLVARQPRHPITWLMAAIVLSAALGGLSEAVTAAPAGSPEPWWWEVAAWFRTWYFVVFIGSYILMFHLFPTGRPIPGRLSWATRVAIVAVPLLTLVVMMGASDVGSDVPNPWQITFPMWVQLPVSVALPVLWLVTLVSIVPILFLRYRRSHGEERQQLKWFVFCVTAALALWWLQHFADWLFLVAIALPGIGIAVALLRYRLYDIDRIVSRTTSYALVTGLLLATYAVVAATASQFASTESPLVVAVATLAAAALARPALRRIQVVVDRRFNRSRYDAIQTVESFGTGLRNDVDPSHVRESLLATVQASLQPDRLAVWVKESTASGR